MMQHCHAWCPRCQTYVFAIRENSVPLAALGIPWFPIAMFVAFLPFTFRGPYRCTRGGDGVAW